MLRNDLDQFEGSGCVAQKMKTLASHRVSAAMETGSTEIAIERRGANLQIELRMKKPWWRCIRLEIDSDEKRFDSLAELFGQIGFEKNRL